MKSFPKLQLIALLLLPGLLFTFNYAQAAVYITSTITEYRYHQFSSSGNSNIQLYNWKGKKVGLLIFYPKDGYGYDLPAASRDGNGLVRLYYWSESYASVIDLLRNEAPIKLNYWTGSETNSYIGTGSPEPVGEGEEGS